MDFLKNKNILEKGSQPAAGERRPSFSQQNPKILEVNLIRDEARVTFEWGRNLTMLALVLALGTLVVAEAYFGLKWWEKQEADRVAPLVAEVDRLNAQVALLRTESAPALAYQAKSQAFGELLGNHVYWSGFFSWLERNTLSTVSFGGFSGGLNGEYELLASGASFADAAWQTKAFLSDTAVVRSVQVQSVSSTGEGAEGEADRVNFGLSLKVDPKIFRK